MFFKIEHVINDKYKIIDLLGSGGFGEVYKIRDLASSEFKAMKCMIPDLAEEHPELIDMFVKEANATMKAQNQNVVQIFSIEETSCKNKKVKFFTMEYSKDGDLYSFLAYRDSYLSIDNLTEWMRQLLLGLRAINQFIIHRDLKPENILLFSNILKISDFGISKYIEETTRTFTFKGGGTHKYMAPEIWGNISPTPLVDQYSMGMIFYVLATLKHPFSPMPSDRDITEYLRDSHQFKIPQEPGELNSELPEKLNSIIMRMIEKKPESRYKNVDEILSALERIEDEEKTEVPVDLLEIAELAKKSEKKVKVEEMKRAKERKRQEVESLKIRNIFSFNCKELISGFEKIVDSINKQIEPTKIEKSKSSDESLCRAMYSFHGSHLKIHIEPVNKVNEVEDVLGWGYCTIHEYEDGFNLLLQRIKNSSFVKWWALYVQDNPLYNYARHTKPHGVLTLDELNNALRGLHALHIYQVNLREFNETMFIELVKKLVSL